jgi:hypothetical protein
MSQAGETVFHALGLAAGEALFGKGAPAGELASNEDSFCVSCSKNLLDGGTMLKMSLVIRNGLVCAGVLALGYWLGAGGTVKASSSYASMGDVQFQLAGVNEHSSLLVYQPGTKTVYVYQGATTGNSNLQCSFQFQLGRPGGAIQRLPCPVPSLLP